MSNSSSKRPRKFRRILIANRGEIAVRCIRGAKEHGASAIAIYSEVDEQSRHVNDADVAVCIGGADPASSYLDIGRIVAAARESRAEAVHPGYGFLAENAEFARAVEQAGLVFIGPTPEAMEQLGDKRSAKAIAESAGVPCVPGYDGRDASDEAMLAEAKRIGFPLLVKASAGGGGRGMRLVADESQFLAALDAGRRAAKVAVDDDRMLLERYIHPSRHIEVQILGDGHGNAVAFGERECWIQRRDQKILEESPSPSVDEPLRARLERSAIELARAVRYRGAGTVEFLLDDHGSYYFLEVNTRLQVEHPVTEFVTGQDLVALQLAVAGGARIEDLFKTRPGPTQLIGHALEARICAEDPDHDFAPAAGRLEICVEPRGPGIRVDSGFDAGAEISPHYDSLIAKLIVHAPDRAACLARMEIALTQSAWLGIPTNVDFLLRVIRHEAFRAGELRTDFLAEHGMGRHQPTAPPRPALIAAALGTAFQARGERSGPARQSHGSPWNEHDGFRVGASKAGAR